VATRASSRSPYALGARQAEVRRVAALARGAAAEQARPVAEDRHAHVGLGGAGDRLLEARGVRVGHVTALRERHLGVGEFGAQGVQDRRDLDAGRHPGVVGEDVGREGVAAQHGQGVGRPGPDDRDPGVGGQRQQAVGVVQQDHRLLGQAAGQDAVARRVEVDPGGRLGGPVLVQQAQFALLEQDVAGRPVDELLGDLARADRLQQRRAVAADGGEFDVDAGGEGRVGRLGGGARDPVEGLEESDAEVVGHDRAGEAPLLAQETGQQPGVRGGRDTVRLGVGGHHRAGAALAQGHLEGREGDVGELADAGPDRCEVAGTGRGGVPGEVLERGDDTGRLQAPHIRGADRADQVRVLADRLLHPAPARIAYDVQHGREALVDTGRAQVGADAPGHLLDQRRIPGRPPGERDRVGRGLPGGEAGQAFLVRDRRDAEAAGPGDTALGAGQCLRAERRVHGRGAEGAGELAQAVGDQLVPFLVGALDGHVVLVRSDSAAVRRGAHPHAVQLGGLLLQGHPREQVVDAGGGGQRGITPGRGGHEAPVGWTGRPSHERVEAPADRVPRPLLRMFRCVCRMFREPMAP
jgi:hypothetical protein